MLTTPTDEQIETTVHETIIKILRRHEREPVPFDNEDDLVATGLKSLDLASVVAVLEQAWHVDPFLEHRSITEVRTVGDLCRAYRECLRERGGGD